MTTGKGSKQLGQLADLADFYRSFGSILDNIRPLLPSVTINCPSVSPEPIDVYLGKWDGAKFAEILLKTVNPGQTFSQKLESVEEFSGFKKGDSLMVRVKKNVAIYNLKNLESYFGYGLTVTPAVYPWWKPYATAVRWGPDNPYLIQPSATIYSYVIPEWEDVFYYFRIG